MEGLQERTIGELVTSDGLALHCDVRWSREPPMVIIINTDEVWAGPIDQDKNKDEKRTKLALSGKSPDQFEVTFDRKQGVLEWKKFTTTGKSTFKIKVGVARVRKTTRPGRAIEDVLIHAQRRVHNAKKEKEDLEKSAATLIGETQQLSELVDSYKALLQSDLEQKQGLICDALNEKKKIIRQFSSPGDEDGKKRRASIDVILEEPENSPPASAAKIPPKDLYLCDTETDTDTDKSWDESDPRLLITSKDEDPPPLLTHRSSSISRTIINRDMPPCMTQASKEGAQKHKGSSVVKAGKRRKIVKLAHDSEDDLEDL